VDDLTRFDEAVKTLAAAAGRATTAADAIDAILAAPPRASNVKSLHDAPAIQAFRTELAAGMVRAETAIRVLDFAAQLVNLLSRGVV
jgi:hypothetical protein